MNPFGIFSKDQEEEKTKSTGLSVWDQLTSKKLGSSDKNNLKHYLYSPYLYKAVQKRAEKVGEVQFYLNEDDEQVWEDEWLDLLNNPNDLHTGGQFWRLHQTYRDLAGESFIWAVRNNPENREEVPEELHILKPTEVHKRKVRDGRIERVVGYTYKGKNFDLNEIIHDFRPSAYDPIKAEPLINKGGRRILDSERAINEYHSKVIQNGGKVDTILKITEEVSPERLQEIKKDLKQRMENSSSTGEPLLFSGDISAEQLGMTPKELDYLQTKRAILEDVAIMTGVPASVLSSYIDTKYSNAEQAQTNFLREYIKPEIDSLTEFLNRKLLPEPKNLEFIDPTPKNIDRKVKVFEAASNSKSLTLNEKRRIISQMDEDIDLEDLSDGDDVLAPMGEEPIASKRQRQAKQHPLRDDKAKRHSYGWAKIKQMEEQDKKMKQVVDKFFQGQKERLLERVTDGKGYESKSPDDYLRLQEEVEEGQRLFFPALREIAKESGEETLDLLEISQDFDFGAEIEQSVRKRSELLSKEITETTFDQLATDFRESRQEPDPFNALVSNIEDRYDQIETGRAETIARTEVHNANMEATLESLNQAGVREKIWTAVIDDSTRQDHTAADGQRRQINEPFLVGGERIQRPGEGSPEQSINCRCVI